MKNFAFQAIAYGANGVIFYSYFDLWYDTTKREKSQAAFDKRWPDVVKVAGDIKALIPVLENGEEIPIKVQSDSNDVPVRAIEYQDQAYIIAANPYNREAILSVEIPEKWHLPDEVKNGNPKNITGTTSSVGKNTLWEYRIASRDSVVIRLQKQ